MSTGRPCTYAPHPHSFACHMCKAWTFLLKSCIFRILRKINKIPPQTYFLRNGNTSFSCLWIFFWIKNLKKVFDSPEMVKVWHRAGPTLSGLPLILNKKYNPGFKIYQLTCLSTDMRFLVTFYSQQTFFSRNTLLFFSFFKSAQLSISTNVFHISDHKVRNVFTK